MSMIAIAARKLFTPLEEIVDGVVVIKDHAIRSVGSRETTAVPEGARMVELGDKILAPGFIDIHIHGGGGHDVMEATPEALEAVARLAVRHGTTSFLPTTLTAPAPALLRALEGIGSLIHSWPRRGHTSTKSTAEFLAEPLGIHLEGPFLCEQRRGVHPLVHLQQPSVELFRHLMDASGNTLRVLTLAPELRGAMDLQKYALQMGVKVALGHSDATFGEAERAIQAGASHAVHTFNGMRAFTHRETGIVGALLTDDRVQCEVITDGVHVSFVALRMLLRAKGVPGILLVSDAVSATGMGPGRYPLGEADIFVERLAEDATGAGSLVCRNSEGKLAGSVLTQDVAIRNMMAFTGVTLREAVTMATWNPARLLGLEHRKGCLQPGADADLVVLEPDGTVAGAMVHGVGNFL